MHASSECSSGQSICKDFGFFANDYSNHRVILFVTNRVRMHRRVIRCLLYVAMKMARMSAAFSGRVDPTLCEYMLELFLNCCFVAVGFLIERASRFDRIND